MMELILREDVPSLGKAGDLVKVRPGYARNYLLPRSLAFEASEGNKKRIAAEQKARGAKHAAEEAEAQQLATALATVELTLKGKAGEEGKLFGSITAQDIAEALAAKGHTLDKRKIALEHPLKTLGFHSVPVRLPHEVHAELRVNIVAE